MPALAFSALPAFTQTLTLDGALYRFSFAWNYRAGYWSMSVLDAGGTPLVQGLRIVLNLDLFRQFPGRGLPPGALYAVDPSDTISNPAFDDLSAGRVILVYLTEADLAV